MAVYRKVSTRFYEDEKGAGLVYHSTQVARLNVVSGRWVEIALSSGGWYTKTTCARMNDFARLMGVPYQVHRSAGDFIVSYAGISKPFNRNYKFFIERRYD